MDYKYCARCKKLYTIGSTKLCSQCLKDLDECMKTIKTYLDKNPRASVNIIAKDTEVSERDIFYLLKNERLELTEAQLVCDKCGVPIEKGKYCEECQREMEKEFSDVENDMKRKLSGLSSINNEERYSQAERERREMSRREAARKMQVLEKYRNKQEQ